MKKSFLLPLAIFASLTTSCLVQADEKPELFATQSDADASVLFFSPDGTLLCDSDGPGSGVRTVYDVKTRTVLWRTFTDDLIFSPDSRIVISAEDPGDNYPRWPWSNSVVFRILDARTGKQLRSFTDSIERPPSPLPELDEDQVLDSGFSPKGDEFFIVTRCFLRRFTVGSGALLSVQRWHTPSNENLVLSSARIVPDGKTIIGASQNVRVFSPQTGSQVRAIKTPVAYLLAVSPDSSFFVAQTQEADGVNFVRSSDGHKLWSIPDFADDYAGLSSNGKYVFASSKQDLHIYDSRTGRTLKTIPALKSQNAASSLDGKWLYAAQGGKIYRWSLH